MRDAPAAPSAQIVRAVTDVDRGKLRDKRVLQGGFAAALSRLVGIACSFITLPIALAALGKTSFGVFLTLSTLATLLLVLNLGLGDGLVTLLARSVAAQDNRRAQELISSTFYALAAFIGVLLVGLALLGPHLHWSDVIGVDRSIRGANMSVLIALAIALVNIPLTVATAVRRGLQESWVVNLVGSLTGVLQVGGVSLAAYLGAGLPWFVFAFVLAAPMTNVVNGVLLLARGRAWLRPRRSFVSRPRVGEVLRAGGLFAVLGLVVSAAYQTDALILSHVLGPGAVAEWGVAYRVFMLLPTLVGFFVIPLWPAYGDALARGDHAWVRRTFRRSLLLTGGLAGVGGLILALASRPVIAYVVGPQVVPSRPLIATFVLYVLVVSISAPLAMYMNGAHILRFQVVTSLAMGITNVPLSIVFTQHLGVSGPVLGTVVAQTVCTLVPCAIFLPRHLRAAEGHVMGTRPVG